MFKQVKKARELQDYEKRYLPQDKLNLLWLIIFIFIVGMITLISYNNHIVNKKIKNNEKTHNKIIQSFEDKNILDTAIDIYGDVESEYQHELK